MPVGTVNYDEEIKEGRNARHVKCKYCGSVVLTPSTATISNLETNLPLIKQSTRSNGTQTEFLNLFWEVDEMLTFQNVGFSNTVGNNKYLTCADCEAGPIGFYDIPSQKSYVALSRVDHS